MAFTEKNYARTQLGSTISTIYTVPASTTSIIKSIHLTNTTTTNKRVTLHIVPNAGSAGDDNKIFDEFMVPANGVVEYNSWRVMDTAGDTVQGFADSATSVTIHLDGADIT